MMALLAGKIIIETHIETPAAQLLAHKIRERSGN